MTGNDQPVSRQRWTNPTGYRENRTLVDQLRNRYFTARSRGSLLVQFWLWQSRLQTRRFLVLEQLEYCQQLARWLRTSRHSVPFQGRRKIRGTVRLRYQLNPGTGYRTPDVLGFSLQPNSQKSFQCHIWQRFSLRANQTLEFSGSTHFRSLH